MFRKNKKGEEKMNKLSKLLVMTMLILAIIAVSINVNAATNADLVYALEEGPSEVNGIKVPLSAADRQTLIKYLEENPLTDEVATQIGRNLNYIYVLVEESGATSIEGIDSDTLEDIIILARHAGDLAGLDVTIDTNAKTFSIKTANGTSLISKSYVTSENPSAPTSETKSNGSTTTLLYTGANYAVFALPVLAIVAVAIVAKKRA